MAAGYVGLLLLLSTSPLFRVVFRPIGKAGRMSLTTYITQSIVATFIFYSYGFGLYGKVDLMAGTWIAVGVFVVQVIVAELWLSKYRMGPLESLWRKGTYGRNSMKKEELGHSLSKQSITGKYYEEDVYKDEIVIVPIGRADIVWTESKERRCGVGCIGLGKPMRTLVSRRQS